MWVHSHALYCEFTKKSMTNLILSLIILCNYGNGKYKLPMHCLYIILHAGIISLIIFLKPRNELTQQVGQAGPCSIRPGCGVLWAQPTTSLIAPEAMLPLGGGGLMQLVGKNDVQRMDNVLAE